MFINSQTFLGLNIPPARDALGGRDYVTAAPFAGFLIETVADGKGCFLAHQSIRAAVAFRAGEIG